MTGGTGGFIPRRDDRRYCARCGGHRNLHQPGQCPEPYRSDTLEAARRDLLLALASGDQARIFVARGNYQRLGGNIPVEDWHDA
jgi:hypothetical protein